jgi:hypothetical protein
MTTLLNSFTNTKLTSILERTTNAEATETDLKDLKEIEHIMYAYRWSLHVDKFLPDGFKKVCNVKTDPRDSSTWFYTDIDTTLMYKDHRSWVYLLCSDDYVLKIGETAQPLGIRGGYYSQPITGTKSRLGRYRTMTTALGRPTLDTDHEIRLKMKKFIDQGAQVSFYAKECEINTTVCSVLGKQKALSNTIHKELELHLIDEFVNAKNQYPYLNKARK